MVILYKAHPGCSDITEQKTMKQNKFLIYFNEGSLKVKQFKFYISIITLRNMEKHVQFHVQNR